MAPELSAWERFVIVVVLWDLSCLAFPPTTSLNTSYYLAVIKNCCFDPILAVASE
jgi:hypothetical protein